MKRDWLILIRNGGRMLMALAIMVAASCTKMGDDNACPAKAEDGDGVEQRQDLRQTGRVVTDGPGTGMRSPTTNAGGGTPDGGSISDDGDDEADNEGPNKRGRNN